MNPHSPARSREGLYQRWHRIEPAWADHPLLLRLLDELPEPSPAWACETLKDNQASRVIRVREGEADWIVKIYRSPHALRTVLRSLRVSKARQSWWAAGRLAALGVPAMRRIACFERRLGPLNLTPVFIGHYLDGPDLFGVLRDADPEQQRRHVARMVALLQSLHRTGLTHGDLKGSNIRFPGGQPLFLDLDDVRASRLPARHEYLRLRDWRNLLHNWRQAPALDRLFREEMERVLGAGFYSRVVARPFRR